MLKNDAGVNYIRHLLGISEKFIDDKRLSPLHISLYYALFQSWNLSKFRNPISICRQELMQASKIGSANTYTKCLKDLDAWTYIKYYPSYNPHKGSQVYLYNFDKTIDNGIDIPTNKSSNKATEIATGKGTVKAVIPSINSLNNTNKLNHENDENKHKPQRRKNNRESIATTAKGNKKEKSSAKKERDDHARSQRPLLRDIKKYFAAKQWPGIESEKFFNYFQSNGWLVGGKTPMKNWKAATKNWMLNAEQFSNGKTKVHTERSRSAAGKLHATTGKNYDEPL